MNKKLAVMNIIIWTAVLLIAGTLFCFLLFGRSFWRTTSFGFPYIDFGNSWQDTDTPVVHSGGEENTMHTFPSGEQENDVGALRSGEYSTIQDVTITGTVDKVAIEWVSGDLTIEKSPNEEIRIVQKADSGLPEKYYVSISQTDGSLNIIDRRQNRRNDIGIFNFGTATWQTDLTVYLPEKAYELLDVDVISADFKVSDVRARELKVDAVSGKVEIVGYFQSADVETISGKVDFTNLNTSSNKDISMETVSGKTTIQLSALPDNMTISSISGSVKLYLPENDGFTVRFDKVSGKLNSDFATTRNGDKYTYKDGGYDINIDTVSGNVNIERT